MMPFSSSSYIVAFCNCICVLKLNKIKWLDEEQILNCEFFVTNFWEEFLKNGATVSSWDKSLWFLVHSKLQFVFIAIGRVDYRCKRRILLLKNAELLEMIWEKILSCHSWAMWTTLFTASEKFHKWGEDFLDKVVCALTQSYWNSDCGRWAVTGCVSPPALPEPYTSYASVLCLLLLCLCKHRSKLSLIHLFSFYIEHKGSC